MPPPRAGAIAGEGAVVHSQRAALTLKMPAAAAGTIAGEGAVAHVHRTAVVRCAAAVVALLPEKVLLLTVSMPSAVVDAAAVV